jgi:hypothetical protein
MGASAACGDGGAGGGDGAPDGEGDGGRPGEASDGGDDGLIDGGGGGGPADELATAAGCAGLFNPEQVLRLELEMAGGDLAALRADTTNSVLFPAELRCEGEAAVSVGVRRKRSGGTDKPGLKIDIDWAVPGQYWHGLRKLSLENGISEGSDEAGARDVVAEYLAWRIMGRSGAMASRAAFVEVVVNGDDLGVYTNVEVVDKRFLRSRVGDDSGWLFKRSGSTEDGYKTREMEANPDEDAFCFLRKTSACAPPAELESWLPAHLDLTQMIRFGGANALIANTDSPLSKDNNYYFYDRAAGRVYFPWDLDTAMRSAELPMFRAQVSGGVSFYWDALFAHWEAEYTATWAGLLGGALALAEIEAEIDRAERVAGARLDADPALSGGAASAAEDLRDWWRARHAAAVAEVAGH